MNDLVFVENGQVVTDSLTVAEVFGKDHDKVKRDIQNQIHKLVEAGEISFSTANFGVSNYTTDRGREYVKINLTEEAFTLVAMSYVTPEAMRFKIKFIQEFKRMREELLSPKILSEKEQLIAAMRLSIEHEEKFQEHGERIAELETKVQERITLESGEQRKLQKCIAKKVYSLTEDSDMRKKLFSEIYRELRDRFGVASYKDIKSHELESAVGYVNAWIPKKTA